jgi:hypothetical protein
MKKVGIACLMTMISEQREEVKEQEKEDQEWEKEMQQHKQKFSLAEDKEAEKEVSMRDNLVEESMEEESPSVGVQKAEFFMKLLFAQLGMFLPFLLNIIVCIHNLTRIGPYCSTVLLNPLDFIH